MGREMSNAAPIRADANVILSRFVRDGVIRGFWLNTEDPSASEVHVNVFVEAAADYDAVGNAICKALEPVPGSLTVTVRAGRRHTDEASAWWHSKAVTVYGCILAGLLALMVGMYLPGFAEVLGFLRR